MSEQSVTRGKRRRRFRIRPLKKEYLLGKIHIRDSQFFIRKIPTNLLSLTLTRPPTPKDKIYVEKRDGERRLLWEDYEGYLEFMGRILKGLFRATKEGGFAIFSVQNDPILDEEENITGYYPMVGDLISIARQIGWNLWDEVIIVSIPEKSQSKLIHLAPNVQNSLIHSHLIVLKRGEKNRRCKGKRRPHYLNSVWTIDGFTKVDIDGTLYEQFSEHLVKRALSLWSCPRDVIFDPFAGTGEVVRIAQRYRRFAFGVEINPNYKEYWSDIFDINELETLEEENKKSVEEVEPSQDDSEKEKNENGEEIFEEEEFVSTNEDDN
ncbi:MAG: site-specific DNA-methyltransferase [Methanobacteriota archaeon]|nr:MAG: site-specific DNA-methyltransferase [Euryarchaeota archaeon]